MVETVDPWNSEEYSDWYECPDCGWRAVEKDFVDNSPTSHRKCPNEHCGSPDVVQLRTLFVCSDCGRAHPERESAENDCC